MPNLLHVGAQCRRPIAYRSHGSAFIRRNFCDDLPSLRFLPPFSSRRSLRIRDITIISFRSMMMRAAMATMTDGTKLHVQIVKIRTATRWLRSRMDDLPDYLPTSSIFLPSDR